MQITPSSQPSEPFINARQPAQLSTSTIEAYRRCPRQYAYNAIYRFSSDTNGYQIFWQATQRSVDTLRRQLHESTKEGTAFRSIPTQQEIQAIYIQHWQELGGHTTPFSKLYEEHGQEVVEAVRRTLSTQEEITWEGRQSFPVEIAGHTIHVPIDRVESANQGDASSQGSAAIGDGKNSVKFVRTRYGKRRGKTPAEMRDLFYTLAYRQLYPGQPVELHSHNMSTGEVEPIKITDRKEKHLTAEVKQTIDGLESHAYPAQPEQAFLCPTCPYFLICPA